MYKLVTFAGYDPRTGPHIFPIEPDIDRCVGHIKMARPLPAAIEHYIRTAKPIPGKTQLLIDAMGAGEFYGSNVNGDYFPEEALRHQGKDYGYETFMHYAYPYKHHVNKDPARAYGDRVTLADYDPTMHRVLLIITVDDQKCYDILSDLSRGNYWDVSMGCRVPWDECSICRNRAKNRGEYCPHLRYQMNRILGDGRRVFAYNRLPKFFDISFVTIGAEKASHVLRKVAAEAGHNVVSSAELGENYYAKLSAETKRAVERKNAAITKEINVGPPRSLEGVTPVDQEKIESFLHDAGEVKRRERLLPNQVLDSLAKHSSASLFSTLAVLGLDLRPQEFQRIILTKQGAAPLAEKLAQHRLVFDEHQPAAKSPSWAQDIQWAPGAISEKVAMTLRPYLAERSCYPDVLLARLEQMQKTAALPVESEWYPMSDEARRESSGISGLVPASAALAAGLMMFRKIFPAIGAKEPSMLRILGRHPWLLPLLVGAGVGTSVGLSAMSDPRPLGASPVLDGIDPAAYHVPKTASVVNPVSRLGLIPLAYIYAGIQQKRWQKGQQLNAFDRFVAQRPDLAGLMSFALAPRVGKGLARLTKHGGVLDSMALYTIGSTSKLMPAVLAGAALDTAIFKLIGRLANRKGNKKHGYSR